jgi:hypothetical protein
MLYARIIDNRVVGLNPHLEDTDESVRSLWEAIPEDLDPQPVLFSTRNPDGTFSPPPAAPAPILTPMVFYLAFTPAERIAIKASTDPVVVEFWATYQLAAQTSHPIDMGLVSVVEGVTYLSTTTPPLVAPARVAEILAGTPQ